MSQKLQEFKVGDLVIFTSPPHDKPHQNLDIGKTGVILRLYYDANWTLFCEVQFDGYKFPKQRRAKSFSKLTKLDRLLK